MNIENNVIKIDLIVMIKKLNKKKVLSFLFIYFTLL